MYVSSPFDQRLSEPNILSSGDNQFLERALALFSKVSTGTAFVEITGPSAPAAPPAISKSEQRSIAHMDQVRARGMFL